MAQGWDINAAADTITFYEAPANLAAIQVKEYDGATFNATDIWAIGAWSAFYGYPREVEFFADRLVFAGTLNQPQTVWFSKAGNYKDFGKSQPVVDDDAIAATINARQVHAIQDLVPLDKLVIMTAGGEWKTSGGQDDILAPTTIGFKPQTYWGSGATPALIIGGSALYIQDRGYIVRDLAYSFESDKYQGQDLTIFSSHLTEGKPIKEWAYQRIPYSIVWLVREDGGLLAMTYLREQEVIAWTPMQIDGVVESITTIPEGDRDSVYAIIRREVDGDQKRYVERLSDRIITDVREAIFLDSSLTFDGRNTTSKTITVTGASFLVGAEVTLTASASAFVSGDVGDYVVMGYQAGTNARIRILTYTSGTVVTGQIETPLPASLQATASTDWGFARDAISGLDHLEGRSVGILGDGRVQDAKTVTSGSITLEEHAVIVHAGLAYNSDLETLEVNVVGGETPRMKNKLIKRVGLIVQDTRSIRAGPDFDHLDEFEPRLDEGYMDPPRLLQDLVEMWISGEWASKGRVCIRQSDPLPMSILGAIPDVEFGQ